MKTGILLINLGTPASPSIKDVRAYLNEFLMDPYVLDAPWPVRRMIVSAFILPFRPKQSAHAYASIWTADGSPLLTHSNSLRNALSSQFAEPVEMAMRYGKPSIEQSVARLCEQGVEEIVVLPLYPQHATSTVTTSIEAARATMPDGVKCTIVPPFYDHPGYRQALAARVRKHLPEQFDHLLLSYHGLPERHLTKADPTGRHCLQSDDCCSTASPAHAVCYRHQSFVTSHNLAQDLGLERSRYSISFQSRLGRLPWLQPYTDQTLAELPGRGCKNLAVVCPAFVADNLETLEEIDMQGRDTFMQAGGKSFTLIPCLNDDPDWVEGLSRILQPYTSTTNSDTSV